MKSIIKLAISTAIGLGLLSACNQGPEIRKLQVGEKVRIMPSKGFSLTKKATDYKNIYIHFNMGGKSLTYKESTKIEIYYKGNMEEPKFVFEARELKTMHEDTGCKKELSEILVNSFPGDAIFCNDKLDLEQLSHFKAIREKKSNKEATTYLIEGVFEEYDLVRIGVGMH